MFNGYTFDRSRQLYACLPEILVMRSNGISTKEILLLIKERTGRKIGRGTYFTFVGALQNKDFFDKAQAIHAQMIEANRIAQSIL